MKGSKLDPADIERANGLLAEKAKYLGEMADELRLASEEMHNSSHPELATALAAVTMMVRDAAVVAHRSTVSVLKT